MKTQQKYLSKYYYYRLQEIPEEQLQEYPEFFNFLRLYHSDLVSKMRDLQELGSLRSEDNYHFKSKFGEAISKHAEAAHKNNIGIEYTLDNIRITWGVKIKRYKPFDAPETLRASKQPMSVVIKFPITDYDGSFKRMDSIEFLFDGDILPENAILTPRVRLHYANKRLRIYAITKFAFEPKNQEASE